MPADLLLREFCAENLTCVEAALAAGAQRVELCDNLAVGGTTPSHGVIRAAVELCHARGAAVMCMVRPRGGDFEYAPWEARVMEDDLRHAARLGVDGVVFGCLREGRLDRELTSCLVTAAKDAGLAVTFHMAFDALPASERPDTIDYLAGIGVERILTHGGPAGTPIEENLDALLGYIRRAAGRIAILPGGGITHKNAQAVALALGVSEVHGTRIVDLAGPAAAGN